MRNLRRVRENKMMSLRDVAKDLDVNYSVISYWETGKRTPSEVNAHKLEGYFNKDIDYLLAKDEHANHPETVK